MKHYILMAVIMVVVGLVCLFLPMEISIRQDEKRLEKIETEAAEEVKLDFYTDMTLADKFRLKNNKDAGVMIMVNGKNYDSTTISDKAREEILKLDEVGIVECDEENIGVPDYVLRMYVDPEDGGKSMLVWTVYMSVNGEDMILLIDDASGKIINIEESYYQYYDKEEMVKISSSISALTVMSIADKWGDYLGLKFEADKSGSADWVNDFLGYEIYDTDGKYVAVYEDGSEYVVYILERNTGYEFFSVKFYEPGIE